MKAAAACAAAVATVVLLAGCAATPEQVTGQNYVSGDGTVTEFALLERGEPIEFESTTDRGESVTAEQFRGEVLVVNFWYAACPPCRQEAPWLQSISEDFAADGVTVLGVNVRDSAATALSFADRFGVTYPSVVDQDREVTLAFTGVASARAVPTTLVLDREGRVASRIVGLIDQYILRELIRTALEEE